MITKPEIYVKKIISGGQTGADMGGLVAGKRLKIKTGGTSAENYMTEHGPNYRLRDIYRLNDIGVQYAKRTTINVMDANGTVVFADNMNSNGTKLTIAMCKKLNKPCIINPNSRELREWLHEHRIGILNVAGNRESLSPGIQKRVEEILLDTFEDGIYEDSGSSDN